ncbi:MAG: hypothetical protein ACLPXT_13830 [Terracidiphilus sp.]
MLTLMAAAAFALGAHADDISLTLIPASGPVYGAAGQAVGWGFTLTDNNASEWVLLDSSYFVGTSLYGSYTDYIGSQNYVAGPAPESATITSLWNQTAQTGTGEFDLFATDPGDFSFSGTINVNYTLFSVDPNNPNFDPDTDTLGSGTFSDPVQVNPEPASWILMSLPLALLMLFAWHRQAAAIRP